MYILAYSKYRWRITKDGKPFLSGIGSPESALALARLHGIVLANITEISHLKAA